MIGFHLQKPVDGWLDACIRLPAGTPNKFVDNVQALAEIKSIRHDLRTILRHHYDDRQLFGGDYEHRKEVAREFFKTFIDGTFDNYANKINFVEEWNEYNAESHTPEEIYDRVLHATACADVWYNEYRNQSKYAHIQLILSNCAVGNDIPVGIAKAAADYAAVLGYHPYIHYVTQSGDQDWIDECIELGLDPSTFVYPMIDPLDWKYHSGRWVGMDRNFKAKGYTVRWIFTEGGNYISATGGWRDPNVCNGNVECYVNSQRYWLDKTVAWNKENNNRALGVTLFNSGDNDGVWKQFENTAHEMHAFADMLENYQPPVIDPPDPPPGDDWQQVIWDESLEQQTIQLNPDAALQGAILNDGFIAVSSEWWQEIEMVTRACQVGEHLKTGERRVYYAVVPNWNEVEHFTDPKASG